MTRFPDEVPVTDAVEPLDDGADAAGPAPLETDESDWQEQHQVVDDFGEDEFR